MLRRLEIKIAFYALLNPSDNQKLIYSILRRKNIFMLYSLHVLSLQNYFL